MLLTGLLLGEALEDAIVTFNEAKEGVCSKTYDYLDQRNVEFNSDFDIFMQTTSSLKHSIATLIEDNFASVWETPQGIKFLTRFEKVRKEASNPDPTNCHSSLSDHQHWICCYP